MSQIATVHAAELAGTTSRLVRVEIDMQVGLPTFSIVGLADKAVSEAKERVSSALKNSGFKPPHRENKRVVVNLAPADVKKNGSQYDLAIAVGYARASGQLRGAEVDQGVFLGELGLNGEVRPVPGVLSAALCAQENGYRHLFIPRANAAELQYLSGITVWPIDTFSALVDHLEARALLTPLVPQVFVPVYPEGGVDISHIRGHAAAKRALAVAAAGLHHLLMSGPPGSGKTMLAQALISILPPLSFTEALAVTQLHDLGGILGPGHFVTTRPFRTPHHSASLVALVGGGPYLKPGEISLAHHGVLFLDELPEFHRDALEALRQPLESGAIHLSRSKGYSDLPASFLLVAASNPCPCGYYQDDLRECTCRPYEVHAYQRKLSGPLLDRIDMHLWVDRIHARDLASDGDENELSLYRQMVARAREMQKERFKNTSVCNGSMTSSAAQRYARATPGARALLEHALDKGTLSPRGYFKLLKVGRTIADLDGKEALDEAAMSEALSYRVRTHE